MNQRDSYEFTTRRDNMKPKPDKYRRYADDCRQEAARALHRRDMEGFLKIADHWLKVVRRAACESEDEAATAALKKERYEPPTIN
jgi:hypothetical protein